MATWKKVVTASGDSGALLGADLIEGYSGVANQVLRVQNVAGALAWEDKYEHPTDGAQDILNQAITAGDNNTVLNSVDFGGIATRHVVILLKTITTCLAAISPK